MTDKPLIGSNQVDQVDRADRIDPIDRYSSTPQLMDPTSERQPEDRPRLPRPHTIAELKIALLDIAKPRGDIFLDRVAWHLQQRGANVLRYRKPTFTRPAPLQLIQEISLHAEVVVEALAD